MELLSDRFLTSVFSSCVFWFLALLLMSVSYKLIDWVLMPGLEFADELRKGNIAVAIVIAAFMLAIGLIIYGVTN